MVKAGPHRIIFSRKGFDGGSGGVPSPILDGAPVSIPIPTSWRSATTYGDIGLGDIVHDLTKGRIRASSLCHLDPDLGVGAFGQVGRAQSHLEKHAVGPGDLFLFWGLFQPAELRQSGYSYVAKAPREHRIFGWLLVDDVVRLGPDGSWAVEENPALCTHPHCRGGWPDNNTLYLAAKKLRIGTKRLDIAGAGVFRTTAPILKLSAPHGPVSVWNIPKWLNPLHGGVGMTYHSASERWGEGTVQTVARGQEFVALVEGRSDAVEWLQGLFEGVDR